MEAAGGGLRVHLPKTTLAKPALVWMATYLREHTTQVKRGENAGRTIVNANVVKDLSPMMDWDGRAMTPPLCGLGT